MRGLERVLCHTAFHLVNEVVFSDKPEAERLGTRESRQQLASGWLADILVGKQEKGTAGMEGNRTSLGNRKLHTSRSQYLIVKPWIEQRPKKTPRGSERGTCSLNARGVGIHQPLTENQSSLLQGRRALCETVTPQIT